MCATVSERRMLEVRCRKLGQESILGNIYIGRVQKVVPNIQAAFIEIKPGLSCYYSLEEKAAPVFAKKMPSPRLVQVTRESVKTKAPTVSGNLNLTGRYLVVTSGDCRLSFSSKLTKAEKEISKVVLKRIVAREEIKEGEIITPNSICVKRSGEGIPANAWDLIVGTKAHKTFKKNKGIEI